MPFPRKPVPRKCSIKDCKSTCKTNTTFFFPKNVKLRKKWVKMISYSHPEFAQLKDSEIMKLGICDEHFMFDQFDEDGRRKRNAYPNLITQEEISVGVPIISYDSDSEDDERKKPKRRRLSIKPQPVQKSVPQQSVSLPSILPRKGQPIQGLKEIQTSDKIDENIAKKNDNVIFNFRFESPLRNNVEAAKIKIEAAKPKKEDAKTNIKVTPNKMYAAKSKIEATKTKIMATPIKIEVTPIKIEATPIKIETTPIKMVATKTKNESLINVPASDTKDSEGLLVPKEEVEIDWDINNDCQSNEFVSADYKQEVFIEDDQMSVESFKQDVLVKKKVDLGVNTKVNITLLDTNSSEDNEEVTDTNHTESSDKLVTTNVPENNTIGLLSHRKFECTNFALFGSLSFEDVVDSKQTTAGTENLLLPTVLEQSKSSTRVPEPETLQSNSTEKQAMVNDNVVSRNTMSKKCNNIAANGSPSVSKTMKAETSSAAADDPLTVEVTNVTKVTAKDTPSLSESQINILKKSVSKSHGEVEIMSMFYQGDDINVIMLNAQGKRVQLKLSKTANLEPVANKSTLPRLPEPTLAFAKRCWTVRLLSNEQQNAQIQKRKRSQDYLKAQLKCNICFEVFQNRAYYITHAAKHDPSSGQYCCHVCSLYFDDVLHLKIHQRTHSRIYACRMCPVSCYSITAAREHQKAHVYYQCRVCNKEFRCLPDFENHKNAHSEVSSKNSKKPAMKYIMDREKSPKQEDNKWSGTCEKGMHRHLASHAYQKLCLFQCQHCPKVFRVSRLLEKHQQKEHRISVS